MSFGAANIANTSPHEGMGFLMAGLEVCKHFYEPAHNAVVGFAHDTLHSFEKHNEWLMWLKLSSTVERARIKHDDGDRKYKRARSYFATAIEGPVRSFGLRKDPESAGYALTLN